MRRAAGGLALTVAAACTAVGLVGQFGRWFEVADAVNFIAPFWMTLGGTAALAALVLLPRRGRPWCGAIVTSALLALIAVALFGGEPDRAVASSCMGSRLTVVQFNMLKTNADPARVAAWITGTEADVVFLEEATAEAGIRAMLRAPYPYAVACAPGLRCSTMILSRRPFLASGGLARGDAENRKALSAAWAVLPDASGPFTLVAAHLSRPWPWAGNARDRRQLGSFLARRPPASTLVAGDLNLPADTYQLRRFAHENGLRRLTRIRSWPSPVPLIAIDHLLAGSEWHAERIERGPDLGSDHYPLLARLVRGGTGCRSFGGE